MYTRIIEELLNNSKSNSLITSSDLKTNKWYVLCNVGPKIRQLRILHNISNQEFRAKLKISDGNLRDIENGNRAPTLPILIAIADIFNVPIDYFLTKRK